MPLIIDFTALANANPYTLPPADWLPVTDAFKIDSGTLKPVAYHSVVTAKNPASSGSLEVRFNVLHSSGVFSDHCGAVFCTPAGVGYYVQIESSNIRIRTMTVGTLEGAQIGQASGLTYSSGAQFRATFNIDTLQLSVYQVSVSDVTPAVTVSGLTHGSGMAAGVGGVWGNSNASGIRYVAVDGFAPTGPAINPTGTDLALTPGTAHECVMSNITDSDPVAIAVRWTGDTTITTTQDDFVWTSGTNTISYTGTRGDLPYGATGYELRVTLANAEVYTLSGASLVVESGYQVVVAGASPALDSTSIAYTYTGDDPEEGYQFHVPLVTSGGGDLTLNTDLTYSIDYGASPQPDTDTITVQAWDETTWDSYLVTINSEDTEPEVGIPVTGGRIRIVVTMRAL